MGPPQAAQIVENRSWQRHEPFLIALADDAQHLTCTIDGADFQRGGLADAQAARIHQGKARLVDWAADHLQQAPDLILRERFRQPLLPWRGDLFFPEQPPGSAERVVVEEAKAVMAGLEGTPCHPSPA
jgi:hypothetical protein